MRSGTARSGTVRSGTARSGTAHPGTARSGPTGSDPADAADAADPTDDGSGLPGRGRSDGGRPRRTVGTSGTGRSVVRAQGEARTARVPARSAEARGGSPARTASRSARALPDDAPPDPSAATRRTRSRAAPGDPPATRKPRSHPGRGADRTGTSLPGTTTAGGRLRADRIDETLVRLTAAHAGLVLSDDGRAPHADDDLVGEHDDLDHEHDDRDDHEAGRELDEHDDRDLDRSSVPVAAVRAGQVVAATVALLIVLVSGLGWVGRTRLDGAVHQFAAVDVPPDGVLDVAAQTGDQNVLVLATDSGRGDGATTRANTAVVVHSDASADHAVAVTLPEDLEITRPPCERWDPAAASYSGQTVPAEPRTTFDSAYAVGGPRCATRTAQQVTGLAITRFVAVDLAATSALVEAVGGVDVCVERPVLDTVVGPVMPAAGPGSVNGARAGALVRAADVRDDPAPAAGLVQRQQRVLAAVLARALSPGRLLHPGRVGRLLPALGTAVVSTGTGVDDLLAVARTLARTDGVVFEAAPTGPTANSRGNRELRPDAAALFAAVRTDGPLPPPDPAPARAQATPADVTADVLNASGRDGLAAQVAGTLGDLGFHTRQVTNATQPALDTVVRFSPDRVDQARLLAAAVPTASTVPDPGTSGVLQLVLGRSFDGTVRAAAVPPDDAAGGPDASAASVRCG
jgi:LCP family protein required for cell wall assembly